MWNSVLSSRIVLWCVNNEIPICEVTLIFIYLRFPGMLKDQILQQKTVILYSRKCDYLNEIPKNVITFDYLQPMIKMPE